MDLGLGSQTRGHRADAGLISAPARHGEAVSAASDEKGFRLDIQGIRGLALVLVLCFHADLPFAEGGYVGLDMFYVLSGFLITGLIVTEIERRGTLSIRNFYARRAKRLLPLATLVLAFILIGSALLFSNVKQVAVTGDVVAAALYFANWRFISHDVDYFALQNGDTSPVQHFWSLSVEEQFYLLWPVLLLSVCAFAVRRGWRPRTAALAVVLPLALGSLAYSVLYTPGEPVSAYFSTLTRAWQLAAGGVLVLLLPPGIRLAKGISAVLAAGGLAAIVAATFLLQESDPYPGWRGLIPVLATLAIIVAGTSTVRSMPIRLLSTAPLQYLGKISYAWYLWHWPFIVFALEIWGPLSPRRLVLVTLVSWVPAELSHRLIEEPFRRSKMLGRRPRRALAIGFACTFLTVTLALGLSSRKRHIPEAPEYAVAGAVASVRGDAFQERVEEIRPDPFEARDDRGDMWDRGCLVEGKQTRSDDCELADPESPTTVVLFGDSHALQYAPTLKRIADQRDWRLVGLARGGCAIADVAYSPECDEWRENTVERITERENPALIVVTTSTLARMKVKLKGKRQERDASEPHLIDGLARNLERFKATGAEVVLIRDQAKAPFEPDDCVADNPERLSNCAFKPHRRQKWAFDEAAAKRTGVPIIDPMPILCRDERCPSVIGDALVYRDPYHLSATFARTLAPWLSRRLPQISPPE